MLSKTTKDHDRTQHINIKYHYLQEKVASLEIEFKYCPTEQMLADILTKALSQTKASILCRRDRIDNSKPKNMIYVFLIREGVKDRNLLR